KYHAAAWPVIRHPYANELRKGAHRQDDRAKRLQGLGAEVVFGDFLNLDDVRAALRGVAGAYFCYPIRPGIIQATAIFAQAAKEAGVACVVNMSQISAREDAKSHAAQDHWLAERVFDWSGLTVVHLRPGCRPTLSLTLTSSFVGRRSALRCLA